MSAQTPWKWDGPVWDYDPKNDAPWLVDVHGHGVLTGEIRCISADAATFIVTACNQHAQLVAQNQLLVSALLSAYRHMQSTGAHESYLSEQRELLKAAGHKFDSEGYYTALALSQPETTT